MAKYGLAMRLNKTLSEIDRIPVDEMLTWLAFFELTKEIDGNSS